MLHLSKINVGTSTLYSLDVTTQNDNKAGLKMHWVRADLNPFRSLLYCCGRTSFS